MAFSYYVGTYYPPKLGGDLEKVPGYVVPHLSLVVLASQLVGKPVTFEHKGIEDAVAATGTDRRVTSREMFERLGQLGAEYPEKSPVGTVTDAWQACNGSWLCAFRIRTDLYPRLAVMISSGLRGLSMSHLDGGVPQALEVSICQVPARPGCFIHLGPVQGSDIVQKYKARTLTDITFITAMEAEAKTTPAAPVPTVEDALSSMSEEHRKLISAAFDDMNKKLGDTTQKNKELQSRYDQIEEAAKIDKKLLQSQLEMLMGNIPEDTRKLYNISAETCKAGLVDENDATSMRRTMERILTCCNRTFMENQRSANAPLMADKRKADEDVAPPVHAPAASSEPAQFDPAKTTSPADSLRDALTKFQQSL